MEKKNQKPKTVKVKDPIAQILDDEDDSNIILYDESNKPIEFEQIARIQLDDDNNIYVILIPVTKLEGVEEGEGVIYALNAEEGSLNVVDDPKITDRVLEAYQKMLDD